MDNFKIFQAKRCGDSEEWVILCHVPEAVTPWVTWRTDSYTGKNRYWGHYFMTEAEAKHDFAGR